MDSVSALWDSDKLDLLMDNMGLFEEEEGGTSQTDDGPCYEGLEGLMPTMPLEREAAYNNWRKTFSDLQKRELKEERFVSLSTTVAESSSNLSLNRSAVGLVGLAVTDVLVLQCTGLRSESSTAHT